MKLADERVARVAQEVVGGRDLAQPPVDDHADAVGERGRVAEVVGHDACVGSAQLRRAGPASSARTLARVCGVERRQRLVEQQDAGVARERAGERDALALAARDAAPGCASARWAMPRRSSSSSTTLAARRAEGDVLARRSCAGTARSPGRRGRRTRCSGAQVDARVARRTTRRRPSAIAARGRAAAGPRSRAAPCVLPAPDGPTRATVSRADGQARRASSYDRRAQAMSSSSVSTTTAACRTAGRSRSESRAGCRSRARRRSSRRAARRCRA